jgi:hypothetical protein
MEFANIEDFMEFIKKDRNLTPNEQEKYIYSLREIVL